MNRIAIAVESPLQDDVRALIAELNATLLELTPPEFVFHMTAEQMAGPDTTVFIAREAGQAVACGALKRHAGGIGEVKRMYTRPSHRGRKIGAMIVDQVVALARREGLAAPGPGDRRSPSRRLDGLRARRLHALRPGARLSRFQMVGVLRESPWPNEKRRALLPAVLRCLSRYGRMVIEKPGAGLGL